MLQYACERAATADDVATGCSCELDSVGYPIGDLLDAASDALFVLSAGLATGRCETTVRPCSTGWCICGIGHGCGCCQVDGIRLPGVAPEVTEVKLDGAVLAPANYAMVDGIKLVRLDGQLWPRSQQLLSADSAADTFSITYTSGVPFGFIAKMAAVEQVCEMASVLAGHSGRLPAGTVAATMDQVSVVVARLPGQQEIEAVGLTWLARFLGYYASIGTAASVWSPELDEGWHLISVEFN